MDNMMFEISSSSDMPTFPTATPKHSTFLSWNLMVDLTSVIFAAKSSLWEIGVGNLPAIGKDRISEHLTLKILKPKNMSRHTL